MNKRNEWQDLLAFANEELAKKKVSITITDPEGEGLYKCIIYKDGVESEVYAENYFEDELCDLVNDVWHHICINEIYN
jgi:hypothetical protein